METKPVDVMLYQNGSMMRQMSGSPYSFGDLKLNQSYQVSPDRNDEPLNGVTTNDIVKIQNIFWAWQKSQIHTNCWSRCKCQ
ncbi:MAG: hypothetical protein IPJ83_01725 [Saprospiraceae bacterium]|nr:hypothetical protein [Candidatus Vicinibacter proximus]